MDIPGVSRNEIDIQVTGNQLTISGQRNNEREEKKTWHSLERCQGSFSRSVTLPCLVDEHAVEATYKDGVLTVKLPKPEDARGRKVKIKT